MSESETDYIMNAGFGLHNYITHVASLIVTVFGEGGKGWGLSLVVLVVVMGLGGGGE